MPKKFSLMPIIIIMFGFLMLKNFTQQSGQVQNVSYDEFFRKIESKEISEVLVSQDRLKGLSISDSKKQMAFVTTQVNPEVAEKLESAGVKFTQANDSTLITDVLSWIIPPLIFVLIWVYFMRRMASKSLGGSLMSVGKNKAKVYVQKDTGVTFADVAGVDEAKLELQEVVNFLKDSQRYTRLGGRMPRGVLLIGPPGTGKTMLAKAVAGEAGVPFFSISGSEFVEMFVGVGAARVRDLFEQAKQSSPCIIFIDELDALGKARGVGVISGNDEKEQTLNQLLTEMDGFNSQDSIIILAATNRPEILDPALLRAGRFDRQVLVDRPDKKGRLEILKVHINKIKHSEALDLERIASLTTGFTGADLANLVNEAALVATRKDNANVVETEDFQDAIERIIAGLEKRNRILNEFERKVTAHHEMGHAITGLCLKGDHEIHKVSIIPRGVGALGYTIQRPIEDRFLMRKEELENKICVLLGGRVAEEVVFGHLSTGASDDLARVTNIARSMVTRYGMVEEIGHLSFEKAGYNFLGPQQEYGAREYSEETAREIDLAVKKIIDQCHERTLRLLTLNKETLLSSAKLLLVKETLAANELKEIAKELKGVEPEEFTLKSA